MKELEVEGKTRIQPMLEGQVRRQDGNGGGTEGERFTWRGEGIGFR